MSIYFHVFIASFDTVDKLETSYSKTKVWNIIEWNKGL